jgi:hypothetical protein
MSFFTLTRGSFPADVEARVARAIGEIPAFLTELLTQTGEETIAMLHDATPVGIGRTGGHLADSYSSTVDGSTLIGRTDQMMKLNWVRYGTMYADPIRPVTKLALWWPEAAHPYAWVHGQEANDFVTPVLDELDTFVQNNLEPFAQAILATLQGG